MNDFDFFTVSASSSRITSLMKLPNVKRENIQHRVYYGSGKYPTHLYKGSEGSKDDLIIFHSIGDYSAISHFA